MEKNISKVRAHDAIVGLLYLISVGLSFYTTKLDLPSMAIAVRRRQTTSLVTKHCPVYFVLNKLMPDTDPMQNGK